MQLQGKLCVITGASSGIGPAIAKRYAEAGATLVLCARRESALADLAAECSTSFNAQCYVHSVDLTSAKEADAFADAVLQDHGRCDVLVNNAGMGAHGTPLDGNPDEWETMFALNVHAPMRLTRRFAPIMQQRGGGTIVNIGSIAAVEPMTSSCAYAATKYAMRGWSLSCYQVRARCVRMQHIVYVYVHCHVWRAMRANPSHVVGYRRHCAITTSR